MLTVLCWFWYFLILFIYSPPHPSHLLSFSSINLQELLANSIPFYTHVIKYVTSLYDKKPERVSLSNTYSNGREEVSISTYNLHFKKSCNLIDFKYRNSITVLSTLLIGTDSSAIIKIKFFPETKFTQIISNLFKSYTSLLIFYKYQWKKLTPNGIAGLLYDHTQ